MTTDQSSRSGPGQNTQDKPATGKPTAAQAAAAKAGLSSRSLSTSEVISIAALISFVAQSKGLTEQVVERDFNDRFSVGGYSSLAATRYEEAVAYLVTQVPESAERDFA